MRAVAGIAFVFLGLVMGYLVLSGKLPTSSGNLVSAPTSGLTAGQSNTVGNGFNAQGLQTATNKAQGGSSALSYQQGPLGLPTMGNLNDLVPSMGGMR